MHCPQGSLCDYVADTVCCRYATHYGSLASAAASVVAQQAQQAQRSHQAAQQSGQQHLDSSQAPGSVSLTGEAHSSLHWWQDPAKVTLALLYGYSSQ